MRPFWGYWGAALLWAARQRWWRVLFYLLVCTVVYVRVTEPVSFLGLLDIALSILVTLPVAYLSIAPASASVREFGAEIRGMWQQCEGDPALITFLLCGAACVLFALAWVLHTTLFFFYTGVVP